MNFQLGMGSDFLFRRSTPIGRIDGVVFLGFMTLLSKRVFLMCSFLTGDIITVFQLTSSLASDILFTFLIIASLPAIWLEQLKRLFQLELLLDAFKVLGWLLKDEIACLSGCGLD